MKTVVPHVVSSVCLSFNVTAESVLIPLSWAVLSFPPPELGFITEKATDHVPGEKWEEKETSHSQ